nr:probable NADH dehydrogenase [ubiquinone] 1 alpha subcomplex subunit 5, mitochondrial [Tanacetum cinerariifolium]
MELLDLPELSIIANSCLSSDPKSRPKMSEVLEMINQLIGVPTTATVPMKVSAEWDPWAVDDDYECETVENDAAVPKHVTLHRPGPLPEEFYRTLQAASMAGILETKKNKSATLASSDNRPSMLDKSPYNSRQSRMLLYIKGKEHGKQLYDSGINGPFQYGTIEVPATPITLASTRDRTYENLTEAEKILSKDIWDRVKLLIEGSELSLQERESKLYNEFDTFTSDKGETIYSYYLRFSQLMNDINTIGTSYCKLMYSIEEGTYSEWFKEKMQLAQAQEARVALDEEHIAFLEDKGEIVDSDPASQALTTNVIFQTDGINAFDSNVDEAPTESASFMANLSDYGLDVLFEVPNYNTYHDNIVFEHNVQEMQYSDQPVIDDDLNIEITSDINVISYDQYIKESEYELVQSNASPVQQYAMIMSVIEEMSNQVAKSNAVNQENKTVNESLIAELERCKDQIKNFKERQKFDLTNKEKYIDGQMREEKLILAEESRIKMLEKQNYPIVKEKRVDITPIDYTALNRMYEHFVKHFVTQKQLSTEQAFWLPISKPIFEKPPVQPEPVQKKISRELPSINITCIAMRADFEHNCVLPANDNNLAYAKLGKSYIAEYNKVLELKSELVKKKDMIEQDVFIELLKSYSKLEKHFISFELLCNNVKKGTILELKRRNHEEHYSENLYAVSIKEDTTYLCPKLHSASTKERAIRRIQMKPYAVFKYTSWNILEYNNRRAHAKKP